MRITDFTYIDDNVTNSQTWPGTLGQGTGGTKTQVYNGRKSDKTFNEFDPDDFSIIQTQGYYHLPDDSWGLGGLKA